MPKKQATRKRLRFNESTDRNVWCTLLGIISVELSCGRGRQEVGGSYLAVQPLLEKNGSVSTSELS